MLRARATFTEHTEFFTEVTEKNVFIAKSKNWYQKFTEIITEVTEKTRMYTEILFF